MFNLSTFVIVCAYVWVCLIRLKRDEEDGHDEEQYYFLFPADCRDRLSPPIPKSCGEREQMGVNGRKWDCCSSREDRERGAKEVAVAWSPMFKVYETDFGRGMPKFEVVSVEDSGAISLCESRDDENGGVEVGIVLSGVSVSTRLDTDTDPGYVSNPEKIRMDALMKGKKKEKGKKKDRERDIAVTLF
ncbi:hypothetical protein Sjap_025501 [Stephania japonica]|uniref:Uncharacterized protein n=1 Tax=Stephania japonica TaxID=461633 RepID=A0AAP0E1Q8_9MAGN